MELSTEAAEFLKIGKLFDAAGYSGEGGAFDLVDFIEAASDAIPYHSSTEEYSKYIRSALADEYEAVLSRGCREDDAPSYMMGSVIWRICASDDNTKSTEELKQLLTRTVSSIGQSERMFGRGSMKLFHFAFANYTVTFGQDYPYQERRTLRKLSQHVEHAIHSFKRAKLPRMEEQRRRESIWPHVISSLAFIAMKEGYMIQPPVEQTDEKGAWQLPYGEDEEDDA